MIPGIGYKGVGLSLVILSQLSYSVGAKSQIFSSVAPPGRKSWLLFSIRDMSGGLRNQCFTKFSAVNFL